ncbi:MAG: AAA family ATPase [Candidatus Pacebacteria bacterium]|nr:AAA family ATPase [Candidatus Paceibacterota bacterium]
MKITEIHIKNYKSIKELRFKPNTGLNAFIGENNVGKSNILDAINLLLGPAYPTFNSIKRSDHYLGNENNKICIKLEFDTGEYLELSESWEDNYGRVKSGLNLNGGYCNNEKREQFCCAYIGNERTIVDYLPSDKWSLLGRLLQDINKKFLEEKIQDGDKVIKKSEKLKEELDRIRDDLLFSVKDTEGRKIMSDFINIIKKESAEQLNRGVDDFEVSLDMYDPWNFYKTLQIIVNEKDIDLKFQASQLGMGAQASITVAILKAYSEIKLGGENPIFIDEPELFLHPQAQRNFYKILRRLAKDKNIQIFYTTHSPYFLSLEYFDEIFLVRKTKERSTYIRNADAEEFLNDWAIRYSKNISNGVEKNEELEKLRLHYKEAYEQTSDSMASTEAFFAKKIILVEGESEALLLPYFFNEIDFDWIKERIAIVKCGSKNELDRFYRLYAELGIPCFVVFDGDKDKNDDKRHKEINNALFKILKENAISDFPDNKVKDNYLGFQNDFNFALQEAGYIDVYNKNDPQKSIKGLSLFLKIKNQNSIEVPLWVNEIKDKILNLHDEIESVLIKKQE